MNVMEEMRKKFGGMAEEKLNEMVDNALQNDELYQRLANEVALKLKSVIGADVAKKIKANFIDLLDGVDDIPDVD